MAIIKLNATQGLTGTLPAVSGANLTNIDAGKVLQVVNSINSYQQSSSSTSLSDILSSSGTTWETAITPSATSSKIYAHAHISWYTEGSSSTQDNRVFLRMFKKVGSGSYGAIMSVPYTGLYYYSAVRNDLANITQPFQDLASPNTTSAVTYKFDKKSLSASGYNLIINYACTSTITLMEIAG